MDWLDFLRTSISKKELPTYVYGYPSKRAYRASPQPLRITGVVEQATPLKWKNYRRWYSRIATRTNLPRACTYFGAALHKHSITMTASFRMGQPSCGTECL